MNESISMYERRIKEKEEIILQEERIQSKIKV